MKAQDMAAISISGPALLADLRNQRINTKWKKQKAALQWREVNPDQINNEVRDSDDPNSDSDSEFDEEDPDSVQRSKRNMRPVQSLNTMTLTVNTTSILKKSFAKLPTVDIYSFIQTDWLALLEAARVSKEAGVPLSAFQQTIMRTDREKSSNLFYRARPPVECSVALEKRKNHPRKVRFEDIIETKSPKRISQIQYSADGNIARLLFSVSASELSSWARNVPQDIHI